MKQRQEQRSQLRLVWDFQNHGLEASDIAEEWRYIKEYLKLRFPKAQSRLHLSAYTALHQHIAAQELQNLGFHVYESVFDLDSQIIQDVKAACLHKPNKTVVILVTNDGNFSNFLVELARSGVEVYVLGTDNCSEQLKKVLRNGSYVHWDAPFVICECVEIIKNLKGKPINKSEFGNQCKKRLEEYAVYPEDVGFSKRNPYGSVLQWLEAQGIIRANRAPRTPNSVTIKLLS